MFQQIYRYFANTSNNILKGSQQIGNVYDITLSKITAE